MKRTGISIAALSMLVFVLSLSSAAKTQVEMKDAQGKSVGTITLVESGTGPKGGGVGLELNLHDLPPGRHAIHVHQNAKCDGPDFKSAGPHLNPDKKKHGLQNPDGHHAGDMMNFSVTDAGKASLSLTNNDLNLGDGTDAHSLFANGGTAIVIHSSPDDMKTDPSGNSGDRIACGVISK
jgi:superoxide dismutase, Cu-Zn family